MRLCVIGADHSRSNGSRSNSNICASANSRDICSTSINGNDRRDKTIMLVTIVLPLVVLEERVLGKLLGKFKACRCQSGGIIIIVTINFTVIHWLIGQQKNYDC